MIRDGLKGEKMSKYRVAIVGCGDRSAPHIQAYRWINNAEVVACCAPTAQRRDKLASEYNLHAYANARDMIEQEKPDLVHLVTWPETRVELMTLISDLKVPLCTVEKPITTGVADWKALCELAQRTKTKFAVCHQFRWQTHLVKCQQALKSTKLGKVKFLDISAGMNIAGQGTHTLNYGRSLIEDAKVAQVAGNAYGWETNDMGHPAPAATEAYLIFENGVRALWTSGAISPRCGDPNIAWQHVRVAAYAEQGRVNYEEFGKWEIVSPKNIENGTFGNMDVWRQNNLEAQANFHKAMFTWLLDDKNMPGTNLEQSLHEWKVVLALYTSALKRQPVDIESFEPDLSLFNELSKMLNA
jgi:predicted dehydrogenase